MQGIVIFNSVKFNFWSDAFEKENANCTLKVLCSELFAIAKDWDVEAILASVECQISNWQLSKKKKKNMNVWNAWERNSEVRKVCYNRV